MDSWRKILALPPLVYLTGLFLVPVLLVSAYSLLERDIYGGVVPELSGEGWRQATEAYTLRVLGRSLGLALAVTVGCLVLGYPTALALLRLASRWRQMLLIVLAF